MKNIESIRNDLKDSRKEALSRMISIRRKRENLRKEDLRTTKIVVISVVSQVTLQMIAKLRKPLSL
jgi:prephenate dehydrogenase